MLRQRAVRVLAMAGLFVVGAPARADVPVGAHVGYAFRSTIGLEAAGADVDDRNHGVGADVVVDSPPLFAGFGARGEALLLAWPARDSDDNALLVAGGGGALTYLFDEAATKAVVGLGAVGGVVVEGDQVAPVLVPTASLLLRFPLTKAVSIDGRLLVPFVIDPRFSLAASAFVGVSVFPDVVVDAAIDGDSPWSLFTP